MSDKYVALFSHFIPCGVHEGIYILDGLLANTSDIQPEIVHGDTQAQSYPVFGLAHMLGIQLMPRIRNIKDLTFFRPEPGRAYKNIQALFGFVKAMNQLSQAVIALSIPSHLVAGVDALRLSWTTLLL